MKWLLYIGTLFACTPALVTDIAYDTVAEPECGYTVGEKLCNFTLMDQDENDWSLYEHSGKVTIVDLSVMWCGPCRAAALASDDIVNSFGHDKVQWVTILVEDVERNAPDLADLQAWVSAWHNHPSPVLAGDRDLLDVSGESGFPLTSWPTFVILDEDLNIVELIKGWNEQTIKLAVEKTLTK